MSVNISAIRTQFGNYYISGGQNESRIRQLLRTLTTELNIFNLIRTDDTEWRTALGRNTEVLQGFQNGWTPKGTITFTPLTIRNFKHKVDKEIEDIDQLEESWLGWPSWLPENEDRSQWPFVRYIAEQFLVPQIAEDLLVAAFHGQYTAPTPGTPTNRLQSMNGLRKIINDAIGAGTITPIVTGAPTLTPVAYVDYIESFVNGIPERYRSNEQMVLLLPKSRYRLYQQGYDLKYNSNYAQSPNNDTIRYYPNIRVFGVTMMEAASATDGFTTVTRPISDKLICTPARNLRKLEKKTGNMGRLQMEVEKFRKVLLTTHFWMGVGFDIAEEVFTNNMDLTDYA
jgi:hypothetical protein